MSRPAEIPFGFREFDPSRDLPSLERLAQVCFSSFWRPGVLHWKFTRNPSGPPAAVMAFHEGNLVGFYAAVPALFRVGTDRRVVYQAVDAMVHPDFQRRGLFAQLARKTYDLIAQREPSVLVFGVTNYHILPGHIDKLQSHLLRRIPYIFTHRWLQGGSSPGDLLVEEVKNIPPDMAEYFARREPSDSAIELLWSPETLHWRIFQDPRGSNSLLLARRAGEILGYCVINTEEAARSKIMRMDFARREHFAPYTRHFVRRVLEAKPFAYTWKPVNPSLASGYRGFLMNPVGGRFFSHRVPVITWSAGGTPVGWKNPEHFDIQPLAQD